ncbi:RNA polymerase sigma factor [Nocardioides sp. NPDC006273]|uniref:RNA polymerase sigma factor n=1 Tax=Nocardioides sp. NPDC006273 TaxID=3155598 RepID=UPI0033A68842
MRGSESQSFGLVVTEDDSALAERLRRGDHEAMAELFGRYADPVYNFCFRRVASWNLAEDVMSQAFLEVWRVRERTVAYDGSLMPWLYTVAENVCRNATRGARRQNALAGRLQLVRLEDAEDHADGVVRRLDEERRMAELLAAVDRLSRKDRQILMLVAWDGLSYLQVAQALDIPVGTVRSRLSRARKRVAALMGEGESDDRNS